MSKIITLTSDFGLQDKYVSIIKGCILKKDSSIQIVDIIHDIPKFSHLQAGYIARNFWQNFPPKTTHIIDVDSTQKSNTDYILIIASNQFFIGKDNGLIPMIIGENIEINNVYKITKKIQSNTFITKDLFVDIAVDCVNGILNKNILKSITKVRNISLILPYIDDNILYGKVTYIDSYGNAKTNILKDTFHDFVKGRDFEVKIYTGKTIKLNKIVESYSEVSNTDSLLIFDYDNYLEFAISYANATQLLNINTNTELSVTIL